jgi:hypothetical protein
MFDFDRFTRKFSKAVRARFFFLKGAMGALAHLRDWAEYQKANAAKVEEAAKDLFEGDDNRVLYLVVGAALTSWATMEEIMVVILAALLRTSGQKAGLILYSIINFNVWISLIDELFAIDETHAPLKPRWNKIADRLRRLKDDRDRIAHHAVRNKEPDASAFAEATLRPASMDVRQKSLKYKPLANDDIMDFASKVGDVARDLLALLDLMTKPPEASPKKTGE